MPHPVASEVRVLAPMRAMISVPKINSSRVPVIKSVQKKVGDKRMMKPMEKVVHKAQKRDARVAALPKKSVVRRPPPPRRSVQPLPAVVQDQDVGRLAQQKKLTLLERKCVSSEVQGQYGQYLSRFEDFCRVSGFQWPPALQDVDPLLSDYMDTLFMEGRSPHEGEKTFAALEFHMLEVKGKLHRARRCLKGWRKAVPAQSRLPMPMLAMYGIAMTLAAGNHLEMALKTVVGFLLYLRPGEGLDLRSRNVVAPVRGAGIQYKWVTVIIRDQEGQRPDKTGVFDNSLAIDHTLWAGEQLLLRAKKAPTKDSLIFNFSVDNYRKQFSAAGVKLGLGSLHPYQLRHGGATEDLSSHRREYNAVKARGRWKSDASVRRYAKVGKVQELLNRLTPAHLKYCRWAEKNMAKVFIGALPAKMPA